MRANASTFIVISILAGAAFPAPITALAADSPAATASSVKWTGFYLGGDVGGLFAHSTYVRPDQDKATTGIGSMTPRASVGMIGGFNYQISPSVVLGAEAERTMFSGLNFREVGPDLDFLQKVHSITSLTGRSGLLLSPDTMVYGKLGWASMATAGFAGFGDTFKKNISALQTGVGIETQVTPNISLRSEALYTRSAKALKMNYNNDIYRPSLIQYKLGAVYKFDAPQGWGVAGGDAAQPSHGPFGQIREPAWTGISFGGFGSVNGHHLSWEKVSGDLGPYSDLSAGGGGFVGANLKILPSAVVGVEVSANYSRGDFIDPDGAGLARKFHHFATVDRVVSKTLRVGWLATPGTLLYLKGGWATINMNLESDYWPALAPNVSGLRKLSAWQGGLGVESFVTSNISMRIEGSYTVAANGVRIVVQGVTPYVINLSPGIMSGHLGVAYHF